MSLVFQKLDYCDYVKCGLITLILYSLVQLLKYNYNAELQSKIWYFVCTFTFNYIFIIVISSLINLNQFLYICSGIFECWDMNKQGKW